MLISDLLLEGVNLMLLGMGIVFVFLTILVLAMIGMSRLARALEGEEVHAALKHLPTSALPSMEKREQLVAVISAAVNRYRSDRPK